MSLRVIGAGLGRTGTQSLKLALEKLLGGRCYHMTDVFQRGDFGRWNEARDNPATDWSAMFAGYTATVDWPSAGYWERIAAAFPDAWILLSTRADAEAWYDSAIATIWADRDPASPVSQMMRPIIAASFTPDVENRAETIAAYHRHNTHVRATAPRERFIDWTVGDDWGPLCEAMRLPVPGEPFPHVNTTKDFQERAAARRPE